MKQRWNKKKKKDNYKMSLNKVQNLHLLHKLECSTDKCTAIYIDRRNMWNTSTK